MSDPNPPQDALERLGELERALARRGPSATANARIEAELRRRASEAPYVQRLRWWPVLAFAVGALLMAWNLRGLPNPPAPVDPPRATLVEPSCLALGNEARPLALGKCLQFEGVQLDALAASELLRDADRVELRSGELVFEVAPRPGHPLHVLLLDEVDIEVVGTRFIVGQHGDHAWITMLEGRVAVRHRGSEPVFLSAGEQLDWTKTPIPTLEPVEPVEPASTPGERSESNPPRDSPARQARPRQRSESEQLDALLDEVASLRGRGDYKGALGRLRAADQRGWSARSRQLVSYEIGSLLERQIADHDAACQHWRAHLEAFPEGRRQAAVRAALERLRCPTQVPRSHRH